MPPRKSDSVAINPDPDVVSILYVEDEPDTRSILVSVITRRYPGVQLHTAENGVTGLELFKEHPADIVITDINMPLMDGISMAREVKALKPETIVIALTAHCDTKLLLNAIEIDIDHYVLKPLDYARFFSIVDKSLATIMPERKIREQSSHIRKLSRAVEQSPCTVMITDVNGIIEYVNPKFTELTGYTAGEAMGNTPRLLLSGSTSPETYRQLWQTISSGKRWHGEFLNRKKNGEQYWESASISPILNEEGVITHYVAVKEDITARLRAEHEIMSLTVNLAARTQELEAANTELEACNSAISHDLRSPITSIHGFTQVLLERCSGRIDEESMGYLAIIHKEIRRMDAMINALLKFSRLSRQDMDNEEVDLSAIATTIALELRMRHPERQVAFSIAEGACCHGDPTLLRVVLENLIGNAWKYSAKKESAVIEFGQEDHEGKSIFFVRDNGAGFDENRAGRLFVAFQRLHSDRDFEGFGIGLATVQRIIQRHGGHLHARGEVDKGATFYFTLDD